MAKKIPDLPDALKNLHMPYDAEDGRVLYDDPYEVASTTECTGLIPAAPASPSEVDSYSDIYDVPLADDPHAARHSLQTSRKNKNEHY